MRIAPCLSATLALAACAGEGDPADAPDGMVADAVDPSVPWGTPRPLEIEAAGNTLRDAIVGPDGRELYFTLATRGDVEPPPIQLVRATRDGVEAPWSAAEPVASLEGDLESFAPRLSADGLAMYLVRAVPNDFFDDADVWRMTRASLDDAWGPPSLVPALSTPEDDWMAAPFLGEERFIVSSTIIDNGAEWIELREVSGGQATPLEAQNLFGDEITPFVTDDGLTLYFAAGTATQHEIYVARRDAVDEPFGPRELVEGLRLPGDASLISPWVSADGRHLIFAKVANPPTSATLWEAFR